MRPGSWHLIRSCHSRCLSTAPFLSASTGSSLPPNTPSSHPALVPQPLSALSTGPNAVTPPTVAVCTSLSRRRLARTPGHTRLWARVYSGALSLQPALSTQVAISGATMGAHTHLSPSSSGHHSQPQRHGHLESREPQGSLSQENHHKHQQHGAGRNLGCHGLYPIQPLPPQPCPPSPSHPPPGAALPWLPLSPSSRLRLREVLYCHFSCLWGRRRIACCVPCVPPAPYFCLRVFALAVPFPDPGAAGSSETSATTQNMLPHHLPRRLPFFVKSFYSSVHLSISATLH